MKPFLFVLIFIFSISAVLEALDATVSYAAFKKQKQGYIELYFQLSGRSIEQVQIDSINSQGTVEVILQLKKADKVIRSDQFIIKSPPSLDPIEFYEARKYELDNGNYDLEIQFTDLNKKTNASTFKSVVQVSFDENHLQQSDLVLVDQSMANDVDKSKTIDSWTRKWQIKALPAANYGTHTSELVFYHEIYNAEKFTGIDFILTYWIERTFDEGTPKPLLKESKALNPDVMIAEIIRIDISKLPSDVYKLVAIVRNARNNDLLSQKEIIFQRDNPNLERLSDNMPESALHSEFVGTLNLAQLQYAIKAVAMQFSPADAEKWKSISNAPDTTAYRRLLFKYWVGTHPNLPEQAYDEYMFKARKADKEYATFSTLGFETDRGLILLKYGLPTDVINVDNELFAPPYEIWSYDKIDKTGQSNVKFLFYNPTKALNTFILLHSNCSGEISNLNWNKELYKAEASATSADKAKGNATHNAEKFMNDH